MQSDPVQQFIDWYKDAKKCKTIEIPESMCLATTDSNGNPDARMMLLKHVDIKGFVFYTNMNSPKGLALHNNPNACLVFHWETLKRQIRIRGKIERTNSRFIEPILNTFLTTIKKIAQFRTSRSDNDCEADAYFGSRPRGSQLSAWVSEKQSQEIDSRSYLVDKLKQKEKQYEDQEISRPPYWVGYRLIPDQMEFWIGRNFRLHDRFLYVRDNDDWKIKILSP